MDWSKLGLPEMIRRPGWSHRRPPIGVDFDGERVHWAQLERSAASLHLRDGCSVRHGGDLGALLESPTELRHLVRTVLRRGRFSGRRVVTGVPPELLRMMILNYAADETRSEAEQILTLARERMRDDLRDHVVDYARIRVADGQQGECSALVAVAPEEPVVEHLERLRAAGLEVAALEIAPMAIRRLVVSSLRGRVGADHDALALVVRMGVASTELLLLAGRRLLLYRDIDIGTESMIESVTKGLDCDPTAASELLERFGVGAAEADLDSALEFIGDEPPTGDGDGDGDGEIARTLREILRPSLRSLVEQAHKAISYAAFQLRGTSIDRVHVLAGSFAVPGLDGLLAEMLQIPVRFFQPLDHLECPDGLVSPTTAPRLALALGYALRGVDDG